MKSLPPAPQSQALDVPAPGGNTALEPHVPGPSAVVGPMLDPPDKVAALLLAMGKEMADRIASGLTEAELRQLARRTMHLPTISKEKLEELIGELSEELIDDGGLVGSEASAEHLIAGLLPEDQAIELMSEIRGTPGDVVWRKLEVMESEDLAELIGEEHPQVAAYILSTLTSEKAAHVLDLVEAQIRTDLVWRMLIAKKPSPDGQRLLEERLLVRLKGMSSQSDDTNTLRLSDVLNRIERAKADEAVEALEQSHPEQVPKIKQRLFRFEDLVGLSNGDRGKVVESFDTEQLIVALRGAEEGVVGAILGVLSPRARRLVEQELASNAPVQADDVLRFRREIAALALDMSDRGLISVHQSPDDSE